MNNMLNGCVAVKGYEVDGKEFRIESLKQLIELLILNKELHLSYFDNEEDLDIWIKCL